MKLRIINIIILLVLFCANTNTLKSAESEKFNISAKIYDNHKAKKFNQKYQLIIPYQDFRFMVKLFLKKMDKDDAKIDTINTSYFLQPNVYGISKNKTSFKKDISIENPFITWFQPLNFKDNRVYYFYENKLIESDYNLKSIKEYFLQGNNNGNDFDIDYHGVDTDDNYVYAVRPRVKSIFLNDDSLKITDFVFFRYNKTTFEKEDLFAASDVVTEKMLNPLLFEGPETSPLYDAWDIYHWNWIQVNNNKILINYAYCGFQQIDLETKKEDWHWSINDNSFNNIEGIGDLSSPFYTHHLNKIKSGPYKGMYSYFENGFESTDSLGNEIDIPSRARIFEIDSSNNSINIVWEQIYNFESSAFGSVNVFDDYVLVNVGWGPTEQYVKKSINELDAFSSMNNFPETLKPSLYLYDSKGNIISEYKFAPGFFSYIVTASEKTNIKKNKTPQSWIKKT